MMSADQDVWLIGGGGHAKVVAATFQACGWRIEGVFDRDPESWGRKILGIDIVGDVPEASWWRQTRIYAFLSIGSNASRKRLATTLSSVKWATVVHPSATVHSSAVLGPGVLVCAHAVIQPDAKVGAHTIINTGAVVEHDNCIADYCLIGPRVCLAGGTKVGVGALVGAGATAIPGIRIGAWSTVGAGSVMTADVPENVTVVGVPAHIVKSTAHVGDLEQ